jgi:hypothetical protein
MNCFPVLVARGGVARGRGEVIQCPAARALDGEADVHAFTELLAAVAAADFHVLCHVSLLALTIAFGRFELEAGGLGVAHWCNSGLMWPCRVFPALGTAAVLTW